MKRVHAIVVAYNGIRWIEMCLESLRDSRYPVETMVIDNGSTDGTREAVESGFPEARLVKANSNLGFGRANNIGMERALARDADFVFLLNQDARVRPDTIGKLVEASRENGDFGIVSPVHLNGEGTGLDGGFASYLDRDLRGRLEDGEAGNGVRKGESARYGPKEIVEVEFVNAAAWLVPCRCLRIVGLFDKRFHMYGEDDNLIRRMKYHGYRIGVVPGAFICHDREGRGGQRDVMSSWEHRMNVFRVHLLDPNRPLMRRLTAELGRNLKGMLSTLVRGNLREALAHLKVLVAGLPKVPGLYRRSEEYKRESPLQ